MRLLTLLVLLLLVPSTYSQPKPRATTGLDDRVIVTPRKVVIVRRGAIAKQFPERRRATLVYPIISGLKDAQVLRRVQSLLTIKNAFDSTLEEYRTEVWLEEASYEVNYNRNYILDITFTQSGVGAYPDTGTKHFAISLKNGSVIKARDVFLNDKLESLTALVNRRLQAELKRNLDEISSSSDPEDAKTVKEMQEALQFTLENLDEFTVGAKGITFMYDAGYPHAIQALEPDGNFFFSYSELKPFIKPAGLLGQFVK